MNKILKSFFEIVSYLYPAELIRIVNGTKKYLYGAKIKRKLKEHGQDVKISPPMVLRGEQYICIGENFSAREGLMLQCWDQHEGEKYCPHIRIGSNAELGRFNHIGCINEIDIGDNLLTGSNVHITDHNHGEIIEEEKALPPVKRKLYSKGKVVIGNNVWLGDNVMIMPGVTIGDNVIVGANAVVTKNIESNCVVAGVPAEVIKKFC